MRQLLRFLLALMAGSSLYLTAACDRLDSVRQPGGVDYSGAVIGADSDTFIRKGFLTGTTLNMHFDVDAAEGVSPGMISTSGPTDQDVKVFDATPLDVISGLENDQLSLFTFPGAERLRNYMFYARPLAGPLASLTAFVVVSLLPGAEAEVRVLARPGANADSDYFGVFKLKKVP